MDGWNQITRETYESSPDATEQYHQTKAGAGPHTDKPAKNVGKRAAFSHGWLEDRFAKEASQQWRHRDHGLRKKIAGRKDASLQIWRNFCLHERFDRNIHNRFKDRIKYHCNHPHNENLSHTKKCES